MERLYFEAAKNKIRLPTCQKHFGENLSFVLEQKLGVLIKNFSSENFNLNC